MKVGDLVKSLRFNNSLGVIVGKDHRSHGDTCSMYYVHWQRSGRIELAWIGGLNVISEGKK